MHLNYPKTTPTSTVHPHLHCPQKSCLPQNQSLLPKKVGDSWSRPLLPSFYRKGSLENMNRNAIPPQDFPLPKVH